LAAALRAALDRELAGAVALRHDLHAHAELSGSEHQTAAKVAAALGDPDAPPVAGTGRLVRIGPADGPCIAVRAELDALPVVEETGVSWASANGAMHACGHDVHLAALAALGRAARSVAATAGLPAALLAVLQPREEAYPSGAKDIALAAAFTAQRPTAVIGAHLQHQVPAGTVSAAPGTVNASVDDFEIRVEGTAGHAGYPHLAVDPVPALCQTVVALQQIASRRTDPVHAVVVSVGVLQAGQATNVIPASASARGTMRALDPADRPRLRDWLREIAEHTARSYGCRATVTIEESEPALVNSETLAVATWPALREAGFGIDASFRSCGADDFSFYTPVAPILMLFVGSGGGFTLHHPKFLPPDEAVGQVASVMLAGYLAALSLLLSVVRVGRDRAGPGDALVDGRVDHRVGAVRVLRRDDVGAGRVGDHRFEDGAGGGALVGRVRDPVRPAAGKPAAVRPAELDGGPADAVARRRVDLHPGHGGENLVERGAQGRADERVPEHVARLLEHHVIAAHDHPAAHRGGTAGLLRQRRGRIHLLLPQRDQRCAQGRRARRHGRELCRGR
jgi:amidohydrolase